MATPLRRVIYSAVTGDATIAALIGTRCYPERLPENATFPAVSFIAHVSDNDSDYRTHTSGKVARSVARTQFNAYAESGDAADELARALVDLWSGYKNGSTVGYAQIMNRIDTVETAINRNRVIVDVMIEHERG